VAGVKQTNQNQMEEQSMPTGMVKEITANGNGTSSSSPAIFFQPPPKKSRTINANVWNTNFPGALSTAARHQAQTSQITKVTLHFKSLGVFTVFGQLSKTKPQRHHQLLGQQAAMHKFGQWK
jgi:hypothetical protein